MRNSSSFWEKTARIGDLAWVKPQRGVRYQLGLVVSIDRYSYWDQDSYPTWEYHILIGDTIFLVKSYRVEKLPEE